MKKKKIKLESLLDLQESENSIGVLMEECNLQDDVFTTMKNHYTLHYCPFIMLFENPENSSAESGELAHKIQVKEHYEASNKKAPEEYVRWSFSSYFHSKPILIL